MKDIKEEIEKTLRELIDTGNKVLNLKEKLAQLRNDFIVLSEGDPASRVESYNAFVEKTFRRITGAKNINFDLTMFQDEKGNLKVQQHIRMDRDTKHAGQ